MKKRKPTEANLQTLSKTKNVGQLSFADDVEDGEFPPRPKKEKKPVEEEKKVQVTEVLSPKLPKPKVNLLEEDEETKRQKQEALEVDLDYSAQGEVLGWL